MSLFQEFDQKRGVERPTPPPLEKKPAPGDVSAILKLAFAGSLKKSVLIPVQPSFQAVYGERFWLCPDEDQAMDKQRTSGLLAFYPGELQKVIHLAAKSREEAAQLTLVKRTFGGLIK